ncbi:MAG: DUF3817 domain-containing protein [Frankia sp.]|nr:DUF3817 domain-containing protein [Frankia sp.]
MPDATPHATPSGADQRAAEGPRALARVISLAEAVSFLLLLVAAVVKRTADAPEGVAVLGPIHGALFVAYVLALVILAVNARWPVVRALLAIVAGALPFAPLFVERAWLRPAAAPAATDERPAPPLPA